MGRVYCQQHGKGVRSCALEAGRAKRRDENSTAREFSGMKTKTETSLHETGGRVSQQRGGGQRYSDWTEGTDFKFGFVKGMKDMVRKKSWPGVVMATEVCALMEGTGWSIKGTAKRSLCPSGHGMIRT